MFYFDVLARFAVISCMHCSCLHGLAQGLNFAMLASSASARCCGKTKTGQRCSITSSSSMRDSLGRCVAKPMRKGSPFCMLHTVLFCVEPAHVRDAIVCYMDLETDSLDCLCGRIVEIEGLVEDGSVFSAVVNPGLDAHPDQDSVHGIARDELLAGPCFAEAFRRFSEFLRYASLSAPDMDDDSEDDHQNATAIKPDMDVMIVDHNGIKFDFPFLCAEILRAGIAPDDNMTAWVYVDTLDVLRVTDHPGECNKLQCAFRSCSGPPSLRAHRALDDCLALASVVQHISASLGVAPFTLLRQFAARMDENATCAQLTALLG